MFYMNKPTQPDKKSMEDLRENISKILIKWNMPTRQAAINELLALFTESLKGQRQELIEFVLAAVQQYGYYNEKKKAYHDGGLSTQEWAFSLLYEWGIIKNPEWVKVSEIKQAIKEKNE